MEQQQVQDLAAVMPVDAAQVARFNRILQKYKAGKANLERRIIENEQWWKLRHNDAAAPNDAVSAWLCNVIMSKHADAMDAYPTCSLLAQEPSDVGQAESLGAILPVVLRQCQFEKVYSDVWWYKLKSGTGCYKVFWDGGKLGGQGDIAICKVNLLNLFWAPGVEDLQQSPYVFHVELWDNERLCDRWPQLTGKLRGDPVQIAKFLYDDTVDTGDKSLVVDVYYKRRGQLHYCKYVGSEILYATENEGRPLYDHGRYPFVLDVLFPTEGSCCGYGYIDFGKQTQHYIDKMNHAIMQNAMAASVPRWFIRSDGGVNEAEYADLTRPFVHVGGNLGEDSVRQIVASPLDDLYMTILQSRITELKETLGNRDAASGGVTASVTSASGIASLQEAAGKLSRDAEKTSYRAFEQIVYLCIELIRQFYSAQRSFRITGPQGQTQYVQFDNHALAPRGPLDAPQFDIEVTAQRENPYTKESYNELALQLFQLGAFQPQLADQVLVMLDLMDFKGKDRVRQRVSQNSQLLQALTALTAQVQTLQAAVGAGDAPGAEPDADDAHDESEEADALERASDAQNATADADEAPARRPVKGKRGRVAKSSVLQGEAKTEHPFVRAARQTAANATRPR